jgi:hypothetical protein
LRAAQADDRRVTPAEPCSSIRFEQREALDPCPPNRNA